MSTTGNERGLASLRPLRHRNFALVWSAALVSNIGSWMQTVAVGALVTDLTHQARWTGLVAAAAFLPVGLFSSVGGAMADRVDRRRWLVLTTVGETGFALCLALLYAAGHATPAAVSLTVLAGGCMTALGFPAYSAMLPDLVPKTDLLGAISLSSAQFNLGRVVGPALAGIVIRFGSYSWAFALNAISFGAVLVALLFLRLPVVQRDGDHPGLLRTIKDGARAARQEPGCRTAILLISVVAVTASPFIALVPAVAQVLFRGEPSATSLLVTAQGVGAVAGALALAPLAQRLGRRRLLMVNLASLCGALVLYAVSPTLVIAAVALALVGALYIGVLSGLSTVVQLRAPPELRGRILSLYFMALGTIYPIGAVVQGAIGDHIGLRAVTAGAAVLLAAAFFILVTTRPHLMRTLDDPVLDDEPPPHRIGHGATPTVAE